jgi:hypothetical protein
MNEDRRDDKQHPETGYEGADAEWLAIQIDGIVAHYGVRGLDVRILKEIRRRLSTRSAGVACVAEVARKMRERAHDLGVEGVQFGNELVFLDEQASALEAVAPSAKEGRSEWPHGKATNGEVMEEFLTRDEAVWALIDEVRAFRQGVCCLTHSRDPIEIITDKYWGISSREHIARQREIIAKAKATVGPTAKDGERG